MKKGKLIFPLQGSVVLLKVSERLFHRDLKDYLWLEWKDWPGHFIQQVEVGELSTVDSNTYDKEGYLSDIPRIILMF